MQFRRSARSEASRTERTVSEHRSAKPKMHQHNKFLDDGGVTEWLKVAVLKTAVPKGTVSSNLTPSDHKTRLAAGFYDRIRWGEILNRRNEQGERSRNPSLRPTRLSV